MTASHSQYFSTSRVRLNETAQQSIDPRIAAKTSPPKFAYPVVPASACNRKEKAPRCQNHPGTQSLTICSY